MQPLTVRLILLGIYASTKVDHRLVKLLRFCLISCIPIYISKIFYHYTLYFHNAFLGGWTLDLPTLNKVFYLFQWLFYWYLINNLNASFIYFKYLNVLFKYNSKCFSYLPIQILRRCSLNNLNNTLENSKNCSLVIVSNCL